MGLNPILVAKSHTLDGYITQFAQLQKHVQSRVDHMCAMLWLSYSTVVLYIGIKKVWDFLPKNPIKKSAK